MNDITEQAHQGSVAAIIQVLNEELAGVGIRTRAMFVDGVLQLLCEAASVEQLEQSTLVEQIREILQKIAPRNIIRVNINSRIVREQQLLWLEEIHRDPENQLLWSKEIRLNQPNPLQQLARHLKNRQVDSLKATLPKPPSSRQIPKKSQIWRGVIGGASLCVFLLLVGWSTYGWLGLKLPNLGSASPTATDQKKAAVDSIPSPQDPFVTAVRIAEKASLSGQTSKSSAQWLALAADWQRASDLMRAVSPSDTRYQTAQNRMLLYRHNSEAAKQQAEKTP
jgi:hypothetical protein